MASLFAISRSEVGKSGRVDLIRCFGCGGLFPNIEGPTHRYMASSPGCWAAYGEVLARQYGNANYAGAGQLTIDAYAVQHPGRPSAQSIQSVALHLISLCLLLERGVELGTATEGIRAAAKDKRRFAWLAPPETTGRSRGECARRANGCGACRNCPKLGELRMVGVGCASCDGAGMAGGAAVWLMSDVSLRFSLPESTRRPLYFGANFRS